MELKGSEDYSDDISINFLCCAGIGEHFIQEVYPEILGIAEINELISNGSGKILYSVYYFS